MSEPALVTVVWDDTSIDTYRPLVGDYSLPFSIVEYGVHDLVTGLSPITWWGLEVEPRCGQPRVGVDCWQSRAVG